MISKNRNNLYSSSLLCIPMLSKNQNVLTKKTEIASFRFEKETINELKKNASLQNISVNNLVNHIIDDHIKWHSSASLAGLVPFPKSLLMKIMEKLDDEQIIDLATYIVNDQIKDIVLMLRREYNLKQFLDVVESWAKISNLPLIQDTKDDKIKFVLQHEMGEKWSLYFYHVFRMIFEQIGIIDSEFESTKNTLVFKLHLKE